MSAITTVPLETPLRRGKAELAELQFRRPKAGDLRGISIAKLGQLDYDEVRTLAPRISLNGLIAQEVDEIDTADLIEMSLAFADFLQTRARKGDFPTA